MSTVTWSVAADSGRSGLGGGFNGSMRKGDGALLSVLGGVDVPSWDEVFFGI